jgi:hypothetical protein
LPKQKKFCKTRGLFSPRDFYLWGFFCKGGMFMSFEKSCKFYQDSKCILNGGCCDLNCGLTDPERSNPFYDEIDTFTKWQKEKEQQEEGKSGLKLG